jgi:N-acetylmuramoyl-L-alanine amidase
VRTLGLRDRGVTLRDDLAVLKYEKPAVLLELGFISNTAIDLAAMLRPDAPTRVAVAIAEALQVGLL